jgi:Protein of unknown function (DUF3604)
VLDIAPAGLLARIASTVKNGFVLIGVFAAALVATSAFDRAEAQDRRPFFGELHVHTRLSFDAFPFDPPLGPRDAYLFARGNEVEIPPRDPKTGERLHAKLSRPLDFTAVTDHAEGMGETGACTNPKNPGYEAAECILYRGATTCTDPQSPRYNPQAAECALYAAGVQPVPPNDAYLLFGAWFYGDPLPTARLPMSFCFIPGVDCYGGPSSEESILWQEIQDAAREFYEPGTFTTFVAYEWTGTPLGANLHRNVIFRNEHVTRTPISKTDTGPDPTVLWKRLDKECLEAGDGCDVLVIPHNPNLSAGQQFQDPATIDDANLRAKFERLVEIMQAKGSSECRIGIDTTDERCNFELLSNGTFFPFPRPTEVFGPEWTDRSFIRGILKAGLAYGRAHDGVNPFKLGFVGDTDSHFGTPGNVDEGTFQGSFPSTATPDDLLGEIENNPGGLTVAWAEENSRDSIFEALRRRETYATSGTRPIVRMFGGWDYPDTMCQSLTFASDGYQGGVPMGGELPDRPTDAGAPRFAVSVIKDQAGTDLQRIQIVKGWIDESGQTQDKAYDALVNDSNADVDHSSCAPPSGAASLCTVWTDPDFKPGEPAFYYARILEEPTCRWSTRYCQARGVNPLDSTCADQAAKAGGNLSSCCPAAPVVPVIQERAWTSPIWWR